MAVVSTPRTIALRWSHGTAVVSTRAAMLVDAAFTVDGDVVHPLASAPWSDDGEVDHLPGHLRVLGGDFACLPFGSAALPADAPPTWARWASAPHLPPHGPAADEDWTVVDESPDEVVLELRYPEHDPVERLVRSIRGVPGAPALAMTLTVHARLEHESSLGLHPIVRIPDADGLVLEADFGSGRTYPGSVDGGTNRVAVDASFAVLDAVPARGAGTIDLSRIGVGAPTEEVVQLLDVVPPIVATAPGYAVEIDWDVTTLPSALVWISDRALTEPPFSGRYRGVGIEPIASAFDLPVGVSTAPNPLAEAGHRTSVWLDPAEPLRVASWIRIKGTT